MKPPAPIKPKSPAKPPSVPQDASSEPAAPSPRPATSRAPSAASGPAAAASAKHRIDMRLAPATLQALDKLAAEAQVTRTAMMERLVHQAAGSPVAQEEDAGRQEAAKTVAAYESKRPTVPRAGPARMLGG